MQQVMQLDPVMKLTRDLKAAARVLTEPEARFLVDRYYQIQEIRKATANQIREQEPSEVIDWFFANSEILERNIKNALDAYTDQHPVGSWAKSICGIGPVISAGLIAHISMKPWRCFREKKKEKPCREGEWQRGSKKAEGPCTPRCGYYRTETAGKIWRFAGLDPSVRWEKGKVRPWNARLKVLCWKIGESFVKVQNNPNDFYGRFFRERKELEIERNNNRAFADQAESILENKRIGKSTEAYKYYSRGMLPPAQINERSKRYAVKLFLSHLHEFWYRLEFGEEPPKPWVLEHGNHADYIPPPNV